MTLPLDLDVVAGMHFWVTRRLMQKRPQFYIFCQNCGKELPVDVQCVKKNKIYYLVSIFPCSCAGIKN